MCSTSPLLLLLLLWLLLMSWRWRAAAPQALKYVRCWQLWP